AGVIPEVSARAANGVRGRATLTVERILTLARAPRRVSPVAISTHVSPGPSRAAAFVAGLFDGWIGLLLAAVIAPIAVGQLLGLSLPLYLRVQLVLFLWCTIVAVVLAEAVISWRNSARYRRRTLELAELDLDLDVR